MLTYHGKSESGKHWALTVSEIDTPRRGVGRLRGYGNAINVEVARIFIESYLGS